MLVRADNFPQKYGERIWRKNMAKEYGFFVLTQEGHFLKVLNENVVEYGSTI